MGVSAYFGRFAHSAARAAGHPLVFGIAVGIVVVWAAMGPRFGYSNGWQLIINTGTTIITFLMVFLIQNTQNRDGHAMQLKLDELIRSHRGAHNALIDLEELTDQQIELIRKRFASLAAKARETMKHGGRESDTPAIEVLFPEESPA